jgi:hypothetical protein
MGGVTPSLEGRGTIAKEGELAGVQVEAQNPHLPAALRPAASPVKVTGEVVTKTAAPQRTGERNGVLAISFHRVQGSPLPEGSVKPIACFTFNEMNYFPYPLMSGGIGFGCSPRFKPNLSIRYCSVR